MYSTLLFSNKKTKVHKFRTHQCNDLTIKDLGKMVKLSGWVHKKRNHGKVYFVDLRDASGTIQLVSSLQGNDDAQLTERDFLSFTNVSYESVITIIGTVIKRSVGTINSKLSTGRIEILVKSFKIESLSQVLPINLSLNNYSSEEIRLKYRFLDLRREYMRKNILLRSKVIKFLRDRMHSEGFVEFQTPILTSDSPEGARNFIVPSRLHPKQFYALPQAPQQFKQLIMISGFDKYFQIAPCFRDEDARVDRAPGEFYQLDIEMSFVEQEDIFNLAESILRDTFKEFSHAHISSDSFPRFTYEEAMLKYGSDKPDLRNPIIIHDVTEVFRNSDFTIFNTSIAKGCNVRAIPVHNQLNLSRSFYDQIIKFAQDSLGMDGLAYMILDNDQKYRGSIAKFLTKENFESLKSICALKQGSILFFVCDVRNKVSKLAGEIRSRIASVLNLCVTNVFKFCWITDYPLYKWDDKDKKLSFFHNPFSKPQISFSDFNNFNTIEEKLTIKAFHYDLVCNGIELSSGAIRNHHLPTLYRSFSNVNYSQDKVNQDFPAMVKALQYGPPPHGGIAPGIDRIVMMLANVANIREIIAFPLNQQGQDLLMGAPSYLKDSMLEHLSIRNIIEN